MHSLDGFPNKQPIVNFTMRTYVMSLRERKRIIRNLLEMYSRFVDIFIASPKRYSFDG